MGMVKETRNESETSSFLDLCAWTKKCLYQGYGEASVPESKD